MGKLGARSLAEAVRVALAAGLAAATDGPGENRAGG